MSRSTRNSSLSMDLESVRKQWSEDTDTLQSEVRMWKETAAEHEKKGGSDACACRGGCIEIPCR